MPEARPGEARNERRAPGTLEAEILAILRDADSPLSPAEVRLQLAPRPRAQLSSVNRQAGDGPGTSPSGLSYSTVVTILSRLHGKGLLVRQRAGRRFVYAPVNDSLLAARRMGQVLGSERNHDAVLTQFVSGLSGRDARLLRELLGSDTRLGRASATGQE